MRHGGSAVFVDQRAAAEAVEAEGGVQRVRLVMRDGMGENMAAAGRRLEAAGAPAAIDIEPPDRRPADERTGLRANVDDTGPLAQHAPPAEDREHPDERPQGSFHDAQTATPPGAARATHPP